MRGPGAVPGLFAVESAMDELALALQMDPVELRLRNEPKIDESKNVPFSSRHLTECLTRGAEDFGWSRRDPTIGSMRRDGMRLGWGMAACSWMAQRQPAAARVSFNARRQRARRQRHAGHRHRHLHGDRADGGRDRGPRRGRQSRS